MFLNIVGQCLRTTMLAEHDGESGKLVAFHSVAVFKVRTARCTMDTVFLSAALSPAGPQAWGCKAAMYQRENFIFMW